MGESRTKLAAAGVLMALLPGVGRATTREIASLEPAALTFDQSVVNQLSWDIYRDPFDELQTRPYNLLFSNIGRHPNLSPWEGQEGRYTRYVNALIGNNGRANVDNNADAIQGALVWRQSPGISWGVSAALLAGLDRSKDISGTSDFTNDDNVEGADVRGAAAFQLGERRVMGGGVRLMRASSELADSSFENGVGGFHGSDEFAQTGISLDAGMRTFLGPLSSWEVRAVVGTATSEQDEYSETLDAGGAITDRFVAVNWDLTDLRLSVEGGYNRLKSERPGETEFRGGIERLERKLDNTDLAYLEAGGTVTPNVTLLGQNAITATRGWVSAKSIFQAGETEMFAGARLGFGMVDGETRIDAAGTPVTEKIDDSGVSLGVTVGLRQHLYRDKLRLLVSGHADLASEETNTVFDTAWNGDDATNSSALYAIGLEGVLANVVFDVAWLFGEEAPVVPVPLGLPAGSRRTVSLDRLVFSAAVSW